MTAEASFGRLDDEDCPADTMGRAAETLGATPAFLRAVGEARPITPLRSEGGHRRYSRHQLRVAARARELVDQGAPVDAACRIVILEDRLEDALRANDELRRRATGPDARPAFRRPSPPGPAPNIWCRDRRNKHFSGKVFARAAEFKAATARDRPCCASVKALQLWFPRASSALVGQSSGRAFLFSGAIRMG